MAEFVADKCQKRPITVSKETYCSVCSTKEPKNTQKYLGHCYVHQKLIFTQENIVCIGVVISAGVLDEGA